jgi:NitT/TauT family transport system substrate-binding protein
MRRPPLRLLLLFALLGAALIVRQARAADAFTFGLDWKAEAEYGGYYQALANGIYKRHGLDVTIREGGPQINQAQLMLAGRLDAAIASNSYLALNFVRENIPFVAVAAIFQKDPAVVIAHPDQGHDNFASLRDAPFLITADTRNGWWTFLRAKYGYSDSQIRLYTFNLAPFLTNPKAVQQGYLGSEPYAIEQTAHFKPVVLLVADAGFNGYGNLIATSEKLIKEKPDLVQRFVAASIEGWHSYLHDDPGPANALIKAANPEMTDGLLAYGRRAMIEHGIVESGDAATQGIGAMTDARWRSLGESAIKDGLYDKGLDVSRAFTLRFVDHGAGLPGH